MNSKYELTALLTEVSLALKQMQGNFRIGMPSDALFDLLKKALNELLGEYELECDFLVGEDTVNIEGITRGYTPKFADCVLIDASVGKNGVWCDVSRTYFVGGFTDEQRALYQLVRQSVKEGENALKPDAEAQAVFRAANGVFISQGMELVHHAGHLIGERPVMEPQFLPENKTRLSVGERVAVESGLYRRGMGIRLENDYIITEDGADNLFEKLMPLDIEEYIL